VPKNVKETYPRIGELLVRKGVVKTSDVDKALAIQRAHLVERRSPPKLGEILVQSKSLDKKTIREIVEEQKLGRGEKRHLTVDLRESGGLAVVVLEGRLDETVEASSTKMFERLMDRGFCRIAVDCTKLIYVSSRGASSLVHYIDEARARGGDVKFFGMGIDARFTLDRLGLTKFVQIFHTEAEAIRAFELPVDEYMSRGALGEYVAAADAKTYHLSYCTVVGKVHEEDKIYFESKRHARESRRKPCGRCRP
jgi:anti-anti-sigma factor